MKKYSIILIVFLILILAGLGYYFIFRQKDIILNSIKEADEDQDSALQIGKDDNNVLLKNNNGNLEVKNSNDSGYSDVSLNQLQSANINTSGNIVFGGILQAGSGGIQLTNAIGKIQAISSAYFANLSGSEITNLNASNISSGRVDSSRVSGNYSNITGVGTITSGTWNGTIVSLFYGGTGISSYAKGDILYASANDTLTKLTAGVDGKVLKLNSGVPSWQDDATTTVGADSLDFADFKDAMTLDNNLTISASANNYSINIDSNTLVVDTADNRIGIGVVAPGAKLEVDGTADEVQLIVKANATQNSAIMQIYDKDGNETIEINKNGHLRFIDTLWDDLRLSGSSLGAGASAPDQITWVGGSGLKVKGFDGNVTTEQLYFELQMPHSWKQGTDIYPHVHWGPSTNDAGNVKWNLEYSWANVNSDFGASATISGTGAAGGTAYHQNLTGLGTISGVGKNLSSMIVGRLYRNPGDGADTYGYDVGLLELDFHYEIDSIGSEETLTKE